MIKTDCKLCTGLQEDYRHYIIDMIYSGDWIVERVECENELSCLTGKVPEKRVTISLKMIGKK